MKYLHPTSVALSLVQLPTRPGEVEILSSLNYPSLPLLGYKLYVTLARPHAPYLT